MVIFLYQIYTISCLCLFEFHIVLNVSYSIFNFFYTSKTEEIEQTMLLNV